MRRVLVIGCPGAGKSTFARWLRDRTGLPLHYLDQLWHKPDRTTVTRGAFDTALDEVLAGERWIIDGNYGRTLERRLVACDTVFLLDLPVETCLEGAAARIGKPREDMPWIEQAFDPEFREWIRTFGLQQLPHIYDLLQRYNDKQVVIFRSHQDVEQYKNEWDKP